MRDIAKNILKWILDKKVRDRMISEKSHFSRDQRPVFMENGILTDRRGEQVILKAVSYHFTLVLSWLVDS